MFLTYIFVVNLFIGIQCKVRTNVLLNQILLDSCQIISKVTVTRILMQGLTLYRISLAKIIKIKRYSSRKFNQQNQNCRLKDYKNKLQCHRHRKSLSLDVFESCQVFFLLHSQIRITFVAKYGCWHHSCLHIDWMQKVNQNYCAIFQITIDSNF